MPAVTPRRSLLASLRSALSPGGAAALVYSGILCALILAACTPWLAPKEAAPPNHNTTASSPPSTRDPMQTADALAKITVPALILKADATAEIRERNEQAVLNLKQVWLFHIEGGGQNLHLDEPQRALQITREFLSQL